MANQTSQLIPIGRRATAGTAVCCLLLFASACSSSLPEMGNVEEPVQRAHDCQSIDGQQDEICAPDTFVLEHHTPHRPTTVKAPDIDNSLMADMNRGNNWLFCVGSKQDRLCRKMRSDMVSYRKHRLPPLRGFLRDRLPANRPRTLLYPFSGGDILTALAAFPNQRRYVLLSLEQGGSPAAIALMSIQRAKRARRRFLHTSSRMLMNDFSHTTDLQEPAGKRLPGLLPLILFGLRTHEAQVKSMRTFRIKSDGELVYFSKTDLTKAGQWPRLEMGKARYGRLWSDPQYNQPFSHIELRFRLPGDKADRILQHVAVDLSNPGLRKAPGLERFLAQLGPHNLMVKAASYLMWKPRYADIRSLILRRASVLVGDTSAPPPDQLRQHGLKVQVFGRFKCPLLRSFRQRAGHWRREFRRQKPSRLPFRFGYTDCRRQRHLVLGVRT